MSNPSPPKPWEKAVGAVGAVSASRSIPAITTSTGATLPTTHDSSSTTSSTGGVPPSLPTRPSTLTSAVNQTAANYSTFSNPATGIGASPYGYGAGGYNSYNSYGGSMYNRFGTGYGTMNSMYGGYGGYRPMYGAPGMYGGGMGMDPNNPSLTQSFGQSTQATFQLIEGIVGAFGGFAQMLESTYMATHSSFFAMVSVAEQFGNLRQTLGSILGIYTLMRWFRSFFSKITGRPPPASAKDLTPEKFAKFQGRMPDGSPAPQTPSRKPLIVFLVAVFGLPYLMGKLIKALAKGQEEAAARHAEQGETIDLSNLEFCRVLYDFSPDQHSGVQGVDLPVKRGDLVAVLSKTDPLGNPSEWWKCRSRDGRMGYLPSPYLELIVRRPVAAQITNGSPGMSPAGSRAQTLTSEVTGAPGASSRASTLTGMKVEDIVRQEAEKLKVPLTAPEVKGGPGNITAESFQKSMFNNS